MPGPGPLDVSLRLRELAGHLRLRGESPFRARAYETAADAVEALGPRLAELVTQERLTEVPGIGDKLASTIAELHRTGTTSTLERYRAEIPTGLLAMAELPGLTLPRVRRLHEELGIDGVDALERAARLGLLQKVKGFGPRSESKLIAAIARRREELPAQMILRDAQQAAHPLLLHLRAAPGVTRAAVAGSVRRWKEVVSTIRLVAAAEQPEAAVEAFVRWAPLGEIVERRAGWVRFRLRGAGAGEVTVVPPRRWGAALVQQTGSRAHVAALEQLATERGFSLADLEADGEAEVYARLALPEIPPELREAEAAEDWRAGGLDLIEASHIRGFVHCHTTASDGRHGLAEMATAARERGREYLTITDHSQTASYAGGLSPERLAEQAAEIAALRPTLGIDILAGTESDIRADGTLDYSDEVLGGLDVVIASIHNRFKMDGEAMTRRLVTAMAQPVFKIWGHGLGRMLLRRPPVDCDVERVLDAAATGRAAIEINGDPHRLDLPPRWAREARRRGLRFVISVDAHSIRDYDYLDYGVHMARRAGVRKSEVLNTLSAAAFRDAVRPR